MRQKLNRVQVCLLIDKELLEVLDDMKGIASRTAYVNQALWNHVQKEGASCQ